MKRIYKENIGRQIRYISIWKLFSDGVPTEGGILELTVSGWDVGSTLRLAYEIMAHAAVRSVATENAGRNGNPWHKN